MLGNDYNRYVKQKLEENQQNADLSLYYCQCSALSLPLKQDKFKNKLISKNVSVHVDTNFRKK